MVGETKRTVPAYPTSPHGKTWLPPDNPIMKVPDRHEDGKLGNCPEQRIGILALSRAILHGIQITRRRRFQNASAPARIPLLRAWRNSIGSAAAVRLPRIAQSLRFEWRKAWQLRDLPEN